MTRDPHTPESEERENLVAFFKLLLEVDRRVNPDRYELLDVDASDLNKDG